MCVYCSLLLTARIIQRDPQQFHPIKNKSSLYWNLNLTFPKYCLKCCRALKNSLTRGHSRTQNKTKKVNRSNYRSTNTAISSQKKSVAVEYFSLCILRFQRKDTNKLLFTSPLCFLYPCIDCMLVTIK